MAARRTKAERVLRHAGASAGLFGETAALTQTALFWRARLALSERRERAKQRWASPATLPAWKGSAAAVLIAFLAVWKVTAAIACSSATLKAWNLEATPARQDDIHVLPMMEKAGGRRSVPAAWRLTDLSAVQENLVDPEEFR